MNKYKLKINSFIKNRYREADYHDKKFLSDFKDFRNNLKKDTQKEIIDFQSNRKDKTLLELKTSFEKKRYNQFRIEGFYKKFEVNFKLKQSYNKNLKLLSKKETSYLSYIYLGHLVLKLNRIDIYQKLNIILKILDKLSIKKRNTIYNNLLFLKLLQIEERLIDKILKK